MATELPSTADCVIVGGGVVGCSLAYHLAIGGLAPLLIERGELGAGSTARCAGGVRQQFSTPINVEVGMLTRRLLEHFEEETGSSPDYRPIGYMFLATSEAEVAQFTANVAMQQATGLDDVRMLGPDDIRELVPQLRTDDVLAATYCPSDGLAGPNEVTSGYAAAARRAGATLVEGMGVDAIATEAGRVVSVTVGGHTIATPLVVNCAGAYAGEVGRLAGVDVPVKPYRRHIFVTERFDLNPAPPMTVDFRSSFYFHPEGDGLLLGMSDPDEPSSFDTSVAWDFLEHLVEHAVWRLPALERAAIKTGWAGLYEVSPDHQAIVGEHPDLGGLWLCCGFSGHGFMQAPGIGRELASMMLGRQTELDLSPLAPTRFLTGAGSPEASII